MLQKLALGALSIGIIAIVHAVGLVTIAVIDRAADFESVASQTGIVILIVVAVVAGTIRQLSFIPRWRNWEGLRPAPEQALTVGKVLRVATICAATLWLVLAFFHFRSGSPSVPLRRMFVLSAVAEGLFGAWVTAVCWWGSGIASSKGFTPE